MFRKLVRWLRSLWTRLRSGFQSPPPDPSPPAPSSNPPPLSDAGYERLLMQVLDGVAQDNWTRDRTLEQLGDRPGDRFFLSWLDRFGRRLLASSLPHQRLGDRLLKLGALQCGEVSQIARHYGERLQTRDLPELEPHEYEPLFQALLRRTTEGSAAVSWFLADLSPRVSVAQWWMWLQGYREKLLADADPNPAVAKALLRLADALDETVPEPASTPNERETERLADLAREIGEELRSREIIWDVWEYWGEDRLD